MHSQERQRNGGGSRSREDAPRGRDRYDEERGGRRGAAATQRDHGGGAYRDRDEETYRGEPEDWQRGQSDGDRNRDARGGSWYGREDDGSGMQRDRQWRDREPEDEGEAHYRGVYRRSSMPYRFEGGSGSITAESWTISGPYTGRGPKGYRRSDEQIVDEASQRLYRHGRIDASDIDVSCSDGVLTLKGTVADRQTKRLAEDCVESIFGVEDVANALRIRRSSADERPRDRSQERNAGDADYPRERPGERSAEQNGEQGPRNR